MYQGIRNDGTADPSEEKCCPSDKLCAFVTCMSRGGRNMKLRVYGEETCILSHTVDRAGGTVTVRPCGMHTGLQYMLKSVDAHIRWYQRRPFVKTVLTPVRY
jgi:hypothetical protein